MAHFFDNCKSGFCANFSKDFCLVQVTDFILRGMDKGIYTAMNLTFDTQGDTALLIKSCIGFTELVIKGLNHISQT